MSDQSDKPSSPGMTSSLVASVMAGERLGKTMSYPDVGDPELNAIAGILLVLQAESIYGEQVRRVLDYVAGRQPTEHPRDIYTAIAKANDSWRNHLSALDAQEIAHEKAKLLAALKRQKP